MRLWTRNNLKSEKGNAMLMALSVILTLTTFGTVSLMTSVANVQMSAKYRNWSQDYYALDKDAEGRVKEVNNQLEIAESNAQRYMAGHYYSSDANPTDLSLSVGDITQENIYSQWQTISDPNAPDTDKQAFMNNTLKSLYFYYASNLLQSEGFSITPALTGLFSNNLDNLNIAVNITITDPTVTRKDVSVALNVQFPAYKMIQQKITTTFKGNPIWTNAITAAGGIFFQGNGTSTIKGDLFSADKDEFPVNTDYFYSQRDFDGNILLNDNKVSAGIYCEGGADLEIYGNVYSSGNLHILGSNSTINVHLYPNDYANTTLKNNVYSSNDDPNDNINNNLFFDYYSMENVVKDPVKPDQYLMINSPDNYIQGRPSCATDLPLLYEDIHGGNVYCNSLSVDQGVDGGTITVNGNVTTFNDIKMNGLQSAITVNGNFIGVNSEPIKGDPNASSTVINNAALPPQNGTITLNGKFNVPGTAYAEYKGVKKNEMVAQGITTFIWPTNDPNDLWLNKQDYQTGESITAKNDHIYSAYMVPAVNQDPKYSYSLTEPFTIELPPQPDNADTEKDINAYYLLRGDTLGLTDDIAEPKMKQIANYLSGKSVVSNVFSGLPADKVTGYLRGEAFLHINGAQTATLFGPYSPNPLDQGDYSKYYSDNYSNFKSSLYNVFVSKTWNLGTANTLASNFSNFVNKSAIVDGSGNLSLGISSAPSNDINSFAYIKQTDCALSLDKNYSGILYYDGNLSITGDSTFNGIIYCSGNLNIEGNGVFNGSIICEGNVTVSGNPVITYHEGVIKSILSNNGNARLFFAKVKMGMDNKVNSTAYDGAVRTDVNVKRYQIVKWKEEQN